ncbi:hypothetical protein [Nodosilinea sp. P-1105]
MTLQAPRQTLQTWAEKKGASGLITYRQQKNRLSIDELPAWEES